MLQAMFIQVGSGTDTGGDPPFFRISGNSPHLGLPVRLDIEYDGTQTHFSGTPKIPTWTHALPQIDRVKDNRKGPQVYDNRKCKKTPQGRGRIVVELFG